VKFLYSATNLILAISGERHPLDCGKIGKEAPDTDTASAFVGYAKEKRMIRPRWCDSSRVEHFRSRGGISRRSGADCNRCRQCPSLGDAGAKPAAITNFRAVQAKHESP
jgi:hypothetical protein